MFIAVIVLIETNGSNYASSQDVRGLVHDGRLSVLNLGLTDLFCTGLI